MSAHAAPAAVVVAVAPNPSRLGALVTVRVRGPGAPSFAPFTVRSHRGGTYVLQCTQAACAPTSVARTFVIGGRRISIAPRATAAQVRRPGTSFRRETRPPPYSYRVAPNLLRGAALTVAVVLVLVAAWAVYPRARRPRPAVPYERTPLELLRDSLRRSPDDRRRALDLVSRVARGDGARRARELAWSQAEPEPETIARLADAIEEAR